MAKQNSYLLSDQHTYASGTTTRVKLPLSGYITHIDALITVTYAFGVAPGTIVQDPFGQIIQAMRIKASGARNFVDFSNGRQWKWFSWLQYRGQLLDDVQDNTASGLLTAASHTVRALYPIHLGTFPNDNYDTSVVIPAVECTDLNMEIVWGTAANWGAAGGGGTFSITSATIQLTVYEIALAPGEKRSLIWKQGLVIPRFEPKIITNSTAYSNYGLTSDLPVGDTMHRTVFMFLDTSGVATGTRSNTMVTNLAVKFPKLRETPYEREMYQFAAETQRKCDMYSAVTGVGQIDGSQLSGRAIGLDLTRAVTGDAQFGFTTAATAQELHLVQYLLG